jgi:hypothetical protein
LSKQRQGLAVQKEKFSELATTARLRQQAKSYGLSVQKYKEVVRSHIENESVARQRLAVAQQRNAISLAKAATNPTSAHPVTIHSKVYVKPGSLEFRGAKFAVRMAKGKYHADKGGIYFYTTTSIPSSVYAKRAGITSAASTPQELYQTLIKNGTPPKIALRTTRATMHKPGWSPGKK